MTPIDLFCTLAYPPCRAVVLVAAAVDVKLNFFLVSLEEKTPIQLEYSKLFRRHNGGNGGNLPFFLGSKDSTFLRMMTTSVNYYRLRKLNPQCTIPTITDRDGFTLWESGAVVRYLANKYAPDSLLYPSDPTIRAKIDSKLDFNMGTLFPSYEAFLSSYLQNGYKDKILTRKYEESMSALNQFLSDVKQYVAGPNLTIADLALVATVSSMEAADIDILEYKFINNWLYKVRITAKGYEDENNKNGLQEYRDMANEMRVTKLPSLKSGDTNGSPAGECALRLGSWDCDRYSYFYWKCKKCGECCISPTTPLFYTILYKQ